MIFLSAYLACLEQDLLLTRYYWR